MIGPGNSELAAFWGVSIRQIQRMQKKGLRVDSVEYMRNYAKGNKVGDAIQKKLRSLEQSTTPQLDGEAARAFLDGLELVDDPKDDIAGVLRYQALYKHQLEDAVFSGRTADIKFYNDLYMRTTESLRKSRLMAERLGFDMGQTIGRLALERYLANFIWWMLRCIDTSVTDLSKRLTGLDYPEEVAAILEPSLVSSVFTLPLVKGGQPGSGMDLPEWFTDSVATAVAEYLQSDDQEKIDKLGD